jgi:hypothetical protein
MSRVLNERGPAKPLKKVMRIAKLVIRDIIAHGSVAAEARQIIPQAPVPQISLNGSHLINLRGCSISR